MSERYDANSAVVTRQTTYILAQRAQMYTPSRFRSILRVDNSIPSWAEEVEIQQVEAFAEAQPVQAGTNQLPMPTFERDSRKVKVTEFGMAYQLLDRELDRAAATGMNLSAASSLANQTAAEQRLDKIAATGDTALGLLGLLNQSVTPITLGSGDWDEQATNGPTILAEMHQIADAVWDNSLEMFEADTLVVPANRWNIIRSRRLSNDNSETVLTAFLRESPVTRVIPWRRAQDAGAGGLDRVVAFDSRRPEVASMLIPQEFTDGTPVRGLRGVTVPQFFSTGGVLSHYSQGIAYADLVDL